MNRPTFTQEQKDWICYQIGEWYIRWKNCLIDWEDRTHKLGYAKETLKAMICDTPEEIQASLKYILDGIKENPINLGDKD